MKAGREHVVPLCEESRAILAEMSNRRHEDSLAIFPGERGGLLSDVGINKVLHNLATVRRLDAAATEKLRANLPAAERKDAACHGATVHGFRSSARSWGAAKSNFPREVLELALAHENTNKVESAYQRDNMLEKRRQLMDAWGRFCVGSNGVP
jgi:integrase